MNWLRRRWLCFRYGHVWVDGPMRQWCKRCPAYRGREDWP